MYELSTNAFQRCPDTGSVLAGRHRVQLIRDAKEVLRLLHEHEDFTETAGDQPTS